MSAYDTLVEEAHGRPFAAIKSKFTNLYTHGTNLG